MVCKLVVSGYMVNSHRLAAQLGELCRGWYWMEVEKDGRRDHRHRRRKEAAESTEDSEVEQRAETMLWRAG